VEDISVLQDSLKLTFSFLDRTTHQIGSLERKKIESMLRGVVPTFFMIDTNTFNQAFTVVVPIADNADSEMSDEVGSVIDDAEISSVASSSSKTGRSGRKGGVASGGGDLRKKLLKSEQAKSTGRKTRAQEAASPSGSRQATPAISDAVMVDGVEEGLQSTGYVPSQTRRTPRKNIFFSNTTCYVLLRLIEVGFVKLKNYLAGIHHPVTAVVLSTATFQDHVVKFGIKP
jgi:paired amphipathic helix protein Sin3a